MPMGLVSVYCLLSDSGYTGASVCVPKVTIFVAVFPSQLVRFELGFRCMTGVIMNMQWCHTRIRSGLRQEVSRNGSRLHYHLIRI
jgi:hypothetical protein